MLAETLFLLQCYGNNVMAVIPAFQLNTEPSEPLAAGVVIDLQSPAGVITFKGTVIAAPSPDELAFNPTFGYPTTG